MFIRYGVKYYGKSNAFMRHDTCSQCGRYGGLSSYDTAVFFTLFGIPLIPLGNKRVMDSCPSCHRHKEIALRKYTKLKKEALFSALNDLQEDLTNPDKAVTALNNLVIYNDFDQFKDLAPIIIQKHQRNPKVLHAVAAAYEYMGDYTSATPCYVNAVKADDSSENRTKLGLHLLHRNKPKEARPYLDHIISQEVIEDLPALYLLVEAYRDKGLHREALDVLGQIERIHPEARNDEAHREIVQTSTSRLDSGHDIPSSYLNAPRGIEPQSGVPLLVPYAVTLLLFALIFGSYFYSAVSKGMARDMILVSGAPIPYTTQINGKTFHLKPYEYKHVTLPEGELTIQVTGTRLPMPAQTVLCESSFFSRPFDSKIVVINPDGLGLLINESVAYTTYATKQDDSSYNLFHSKFVHEFSHIDYPFQDFPDEIQMSTNNKKEYRTGLINFYPETLSQLIRVISNHLTPAETISYLEKYIALDPNSINSSQLLWHLSSLSEPERFLSFLKQGLEHEPTMVEWHRVYQNMMEMTHPEHDLLGEYTSYHKTHPSDPYLTYLLGRVIPDQTEADNIYLQSESQGTPIGFGYHAMSYHYLCSGQYDKARDLAKKATEARDNAYNLYFQSTLDESILALQQYDDLLKRVRQERKQSNTDKLLVSQEIKLLLLMKQWAEAEKVKSEYLDNIKTVLSEQDLTPIANDLNAMMAYMRGDYSGYAKSIEGSSDPMGPFYSALQRNNVDQAADILKGSGSSEGEHFLLTYCLAKVNGDTTISDQMLAICIDLLNKGDQDKRCAAKMLNGDLNEIKTHLKDICILPNEKRILALSLGLTYPQVKDQCFTIAKTLNYDRGFPHQTINKIISSRI